MALFVPTVGALLQAPHAKAHLLACKAAHDNLSGSVSAAHDEGDSAEEPRGSAFVTRRTALQTAVCATTALWLPRASQAAAQGSELFVQSPSIDSKAGSYLAALPIPKELEAIAARVKSFVLPNGARFVVLERSVAPTVSFVSYADVGGVDEPDGKTGAAHFLEHLAFKGTTSIGTRDWGKEQRVLEQLTALEAERASMLAELSSLNAANAGKNKRSLKTRLDETERKILVLEEEADAFVEPNEFSKIIQNEGGVGLNAATTIDATKYFYNLPSNKLELWFALESQRFMDPVFRQFNKEKQVVLEERKLRVDNSSIGAFLEKFCLTAFDTHPYRRPVIGFEQDIQALSTRDIREFFERKYTPDKLCFVIVGDVKLARVRQLAQQYFGSWHGPNDLTSNAVLVPPPPPEAPQTAKKEFSVKLNAEPWYACGYHVPKVTDSRTTAFQCASGVLSGGRTSRLYKNVVQDNALALTAAFGIGFPGDKYDNLAITYALPGVGKSISDVAAAIDEQLMSVTVRVNADELARVKKGAKLNLLGAFQSNESMANVLAEYAVLLGDPLDAFRAVSALEAIEQDDVSSACASVFTEANKTEGRLI
ncbi:putative zinc protease y4wA [Porphyridium purpureum]|uniref:Alpha-MPP n=1 Tax=Porphyridium purpureum TaxID=35688 RepID=A0A5J4Z7M8_PORPP|nr:putative zinc protease y4wA [Porphyridium purpureum]|eukprot:POR0014..scf295_1